MITDWFQRLITLENDTSKKDYYLIFRDIDFIDEISLKDNYILLIKCSYTQAKRYALKRFYNRFESIYLKEEIDFESKVLYEKVVFNDNKLVYLI